MSRTQLLNALLFQIGWLVCVLGGDLWALTVGLALLAAHWIWVSRERREWLVIGVGALLGMGVDSLLHALQLFRFETVSFGIPWWLAVLWLLFLTTLNHSLVALQRVPQLALPVGALGGPASYYAGVALEAARFGVALPQALAMLALVWAVLLPLLVLMMKFRRFGVLV